MTRALPYVAPLRVRRSLEDRALVLFDPALVHHHVSAPPRWWTIRELLLPELDARRLALWVAGGGEEIDVEVCADECLPSPTSGQVVKAHRLVVDAPNGRLYLGTPSDLPSRAQRGEPVDADDGWIHLLPGRYSVDVERLAGPPSLRLRFTPAVDEPATADAIADLGPSRRRWDAHVIRPLATEQLLALAALRQTAAQRQLHEAIAAYERYALDSDDGTLLLEGAHGEPLLHTPVHFVGSYGFSSYTFRWAWANPSVRRELRRRVERVRDGASGVEASWLREPELPISVDDAERLAALATERMDLGAFYLVPYELGVLFVAFDLPAVAATREPGALV